MSTVKARPQFTIASLIALTAVFAPAIAVFRFDDEWSGVIPSVMPVAILGLIVLKSGPRCLVGAIVGFVVVLGLFLTFLWLVFGEGPLGHSLHGYLLVGYFGAAIGGGIHAARIERRRKLESAGEAKPGEGLYGGGTRMVIFILLGAFLGWLLGQCLTWNLPRGSQMDDEIVNLVNFLSAITGGVVARLRRRHSGQAPSSIR